MANHGQIINCKKEITEELIDDILIELNQDRFDGVFEIIKNDSEDSYGKVCWVLSHPIFDRREGIVIWIEDDKDLFRGNGELEIHNRHGHGFQHFWYLESVFIHTLADFFGGEISDDGHDIIQTPNIELYSSFQNYMENFYSQEWLDNLKFIGTSFQRYKKVYYPIYEDYIEMYKEKGMDLSILERMEVPKELLK